MVKNLIHRWRKQLPTWVDGRVLLFFIVVVVFTMAMGWGEPIPQAAAKSIQTIPQAEPIVLQPETYTVSEAGLLSAEMAANREQTNGVIAGSIVLILIILGACVSAFYQKAYERRP